MKSEIKKMESLEDFKKVYKVFSGPPYNEKYTEEELEEIFNEYSKTGYIYGAYSGENCVGLIATTIGAEKEQPVSFEEDENIMYLADIAVLDEYRRTGLGTQLMIYGVMMAKSMGYSKMYMRTLEKGKSMSYGIANKVGFSQIPDIYQIVERERTDGTIQEAKNIFLDIDLRNLDKNKLKTAIQTSVSIPNKKVEFEEETK